MIFATVGTHNQGFERLIKKLDEIAAKIDDEVIMQIGYTDYKPENAKWFKFVDMEKIMKLYKNADIIVTHVGAGSLLDSLSCEKPIIAVPRLKRFGEAINDQQLELAEFLQTKNISVIMDIEDLEYNLLKPNFKVQKNSLNDKKLINFLKTYLMSDIMK